MDAGGIAQAVHERPSPRLRYNKCPTGRARLQWLGGKKKMSSWVVVLLLAALAAARLRFVTAEVREVRHLSFN